MTEPAAPRAGTLKVGLVLPQIEAMMAGQTARWTDLLQMATLAEDLGYDSLWLVDHLLLKGVRRAGRVEGVWECWTLLSALAAVTKRVELGTLVTCTGFRSPALLAKMADMVEEISNGRLILGLGAGWHEPEYDAFGYPFDHRVGRFEEALQIILPLLRSGRVDFQGKFYHARDCELLPRGPRSQGPPILIGALAHRPRMLELMARNADAWNVWQVFTRSYPDVIPALRDAVDAACAAVNRDPATLERTAAIQIDLEGRQWRPNAQASGAPMEPVQGTPDEIREVLRQFVREGITHLQVRVVPNTPEGIERFARILETL